METFNLLDLLPRHSTYFLLSAILCSSVFVTISPSTIFGGGRDVPSAVSYSVHTASSEHVVNPMKFVPSDFTQGFKGFASDVVANEIFVEHSNTYGASAAYTFGLGQLLAVLNERLFDVPNDGVDEALRTTYGSITTAYKDMLESLIEDASVFGSSTVYTSNRSLEASEGIKALMTNVFYQDFSQPHVAVPSINSRIAIQTFAKIYDKLIPRGGWYGPSIYSFTKALLVNTFYFKDTFLFPFTDIGKQFFGTERVRMLSTVGTFKIRRTQDFVTVTLPFKGKRKSLVLVLPRDDLKDAIPFIDSALGVNNNHGNYGPVGITETKPLVVQIPALNFSLSNEYFSQFYYMGINNSMCNWNEGNPYFMQPPAQSLYYYLDTDKFEAAAATGAQLNNNKEFQDITGMKSERFTTPPPLPPPQSSSTTAHEATTTTSTSSPVRESSSRSPTAPSAAVQINAEDGDSSEEDDIELPFDSAETVRPPSKQYKRILDEPQGLDVLRFDKPFYWYLQDEVLGPIYVGIVNSFKVYKEQVTAIEDGFDDIFKYQFWSCGPKHLALIDLFKSQTTEEAEASN